MTSISFDRIADRYDDTRGGTRRGGRVASVVDGFIEVGSAILEIGVGTGVVAQPLVASGHDVWGLDLSRAMLTRAADRLDRVVEGDATRLPFGPGVFDVVLAAWAVHLIGERETLLAEIERVLRPRGLLVIVSPRPEVVSNDLTDLTFRWGRQLGKGDATAGVLRQLAQRGWSTVDTSSTPWDDGEDTPNERAASIERRDWSSLWDLDDETWSRVMQPVINGLRNLPRPDQARPVRMRYPVTALERPGG